MIKHPKIVVGVPVYNEEKYIEQTLISLRKQSYKNFKVIISDNASTDRTQKICELFSEKDDRFNYFRQKENVGGSENFNYILDNTDSEYLMWLGAHDILNEKYLEEVIPELEINSETALVYTQVEWISESGMHIKYTDGGNFIHHGDSLDRYLSGVRGPWTECTAVNGVFRREALRGFRFGRFKGADHIALTRAQFYGRFLRIEKPLYIRREFQNRMNSYMERIAGSKKTSKFNGTYDALRLAHIRDYLNLPLVRKKKFLYFPVLLKNICLAYGFHDYVTRNYKLYTMVRAIKLYLKDK